MITGILSRPELLWFVIGLVLFVLELMVPGFIIFFFGVGAWVTAIVCLIGDPGINLQIIIFAVVSLLALSALRRIIQKKFFYKESHDTNVDDEFTGREAMAVIGFGGIVKGKVEFKGTTWTAESDSEIKEGQRVIITRKDNFNLIVEPK